MRTNRIHSQLIETDRIAKYRLRNSIAYLLFCVSLLTIPFNISFFNIIRIPDILLMLTIILLALSNPEFKTPYIIIFSSFFGILMFSSLISMVHNNSLRITGIVFFYKYSLIFIVPLIVTKVVNSRKKLKSVTKIMYYVYLALLIWVYIYHALRSYGLILGNPRVSYPFSNYDISDAHVYSSYLVFTFIAYLEYLRIIMHHGIKLSSLMCILSVFALILTGSKTGIIILLLYSTIIIFRFTKSLGHRKNLYLFIYYLFTVLFILVFFTLILLLDNTFINNAIILYNRSTTVVIDSSVVSRITYFFNAIHEIQPNLLIIGNGPTGASQKWYDGGISILLAHSGLLGLCSLIIYICMILFETKKMSILGKSAGLYKIFTLLIFIYILLSVITEHYLITRNLLPVATILSVIYVDIKLNYLELSTAHNFHDK